MTWKPLSFHRTSVLLAASLLFAWSAPAMSAPADPKDGPMPLDQFTQRVNHQFDRAIDRAKGFKDHPEIAALVVSNKTIFNDNMGKFLKKDQKYQPWESDYVHDSVKNALDAIKEKLNVVEQARNEHWDKDKTANALDVVDQKATENQAHIQVHAQVAAMEFSRHKDGEGGGPDHPIDGRDHGDGHDRQDEAGAGGQWNQADDADSHKDEWSKSNVVKLQDYAISKSLSPNGGGGDGSGGGSKPSGSGGGVFPNSPAGGGSANSAGDGTLAQNLSNLTNAGAAQALTSAGADSLNSGHFADALTSAQSALALDPNNQTAMMILHSAQGRVEGGGSSAGSMAGGGAGERGFAGGGGAEGGRASFAGATREAGVLSPASAASRMTSEQALKDARNAMNLGDKDAALAAANRLVGLNPNDPTALALRAKIYAQMGDYARAIADAKAGLEKSPKDRALLQTLGYAQLRNKDYKGALASANSLIEMDPKDAYAYALRGHAFGSMGDRDAMMSDLRQAVALNPAYQASLDRAQLPADSDILFLFPGEAARGSAAATAAAPAGGRIRNFGFVAGAAAFGGLLLAIGLLQTVLAPLKEQVSSVFTRLTRTGPSVASLADAGTPQPASVNGLMPGLIRGQYEITRQIGQGGMGTVYEGTDKSLGRRVAIKKMREELRVNPAERARFVIEAKTVAALHHPNVVDIYAIAEDGQDVFLVFEFVDGKTVHDLVQHAGRLSIADAARITRASADALTYAHSRGVIHRDMKPSNVMVDGQGRIKVMDFGIARMAKDSATRYSMTNTVVGTPPYMAPEQEQGQVRKESDVYALGICAYEMLTGKLPFIGIGAGMLMNKINMSYVPPSRAIAGLPDALDEVFAKAFQADPDKRYRTPAEFADALESALPGVRAA
ncbi:MAG: protein kinase [Elusimicrobiota bacterium]